MNRENMIEELNRITHVLNGICGRLIVAYISYPEVKEAHEMIITLGFEIDNLINDLMEENI